MPTNLMLLYQPCNVIQHPTSTRERRRQAPHPRNKSTESDKEEDFVAGNEVADSTSPPSALSPRSEGSPAPAGWTLAQEQQAQEDYENELADHSIYELVRQFASAARRLALYDCKKCLKELERLPPAHQKSASALVMIGKVHYELQDYSSVSTSTCFERRARLLIFRFAVSIGRTSI